MDEVVKALKNRKAYLEKEIEWLKSLKEKGYIKHFTKGKIVAKLAEKRWLEEKLSVVFRKTAEELHKESVKAEEQGENEENLTEASSFYAKAFWKEQEAKKLWLWSETAEGKKEKIIKSVYGEQGTGMSYSAIKVSKALDRLEKNKNMGLKPRKSAEAKK